MPNIDLSILNQRQTPAFYADVFANRPAAGFVGRIFISTNTFAFYRDNGTSWDLIGGPGTGTVTGTGANGQVTFWNGASTITGSNDLFWDATNGHLGVNTNAPGTALDVHHDQPTVAILNQTVATNDVRIGFQNNGVGLWRIGAFYNAGANDFGIYDAVAAIQPVTIKKTTGQTFIGSQTTSSGLFVVNTNTNDNHIVVLGNQAPSFRIRTAGVAAPLQCGIGLSTTTNNFIQGAVGGEFCLWNDSVAAQPILFGINATTVVLEAARISAARNFLLGKVVDSGQRLQVDGQTLLSSSATIVSYINTTNASGASNVYQQSGSNVGWIGNGSSSLIGGSTNDFTINGVNNLNLAVGGFRRASINNNGNLGLGVTPSSGAPLGGYALFEIAQYGASIYGGTNQTLLGTNISWNGSSANYSGGYSASLYNQQNGAHSFSTAPLGVAGNPITFTTILTIKATGVINIANVPTSAAGLVSGDVYRTGNILNIVP